MNSISYLGSGAAVSHLQLLQDDIVKDDKTSTTTAGRHGDRAAAPGASQAAVDSDKTAQTEAASALPQDDLLTKIETLITNELNSGKLTSDRAAALRDVFSSAFAGNTDSNETTADKIAGSSSSGSGAADPAVAQAGAAAKSAHSSADAATGASHDVGSILNDFLKLLQDVKSSASTYGASGNATTDSTSRSARLINYRA